MPRKAASSHIKPSAPATVIHLGLTTFKPLPSNHSFTQQALETIVNWLVTAKDNKNKTIEDLIFK